MINIAIVGATGLVGNMFLKVLEERNIKADSYTLFASSKSVGKKVVFMGKEYEVEELNENSFNNNRFNYALFSAGKNVALKYGQIAAKNGCTVIDNSSCFRMDKSVPLVIPNVNMQDAYDSPSKIISNPNCSTIQAIIPISIIDKKYHVNRIIYSTYQAVSGAGKKGIDDLENNSTTTFPYKILNNCIPQIGDFDDNGYSEEELKMINETRKILHKNNLPVSATCVRVPILNSHAESITIETECDFKVEDIKTLLNNNDKIIVLDDTKRNIYPLNTFATGTDEVYVGRVRKDLHIPNTLSFWCVADNIRRGAATNAIEILEELLKKETN